MLIAPGLLPSGGPAADSRAVSLAVAEPAAEYLTRKIESLRTFDWVLAENPEVLAVERAGFEEIDSRQWRSVSLRMTKSDGERLEIELCRPVEWVDSHQVAAGATIHLDLPEMGAVGPAEVVLVGPARDPGPQPSARCRLVTGTFRHVSGEVLDVAVDGLAEPIGATAAHPFWSETRQAFIPAGRLRPGETLRTASGALCAVLSITPRPAAEPVYNLEVDGEHVYYVSSAGVLVHNSYLPDDVELRPYGGPGRGHHVPAKSAFAGAEGYSAKGALAIPNEELARLGIYHPSVTAAQQRLYRELAQTGRKLTWEALEEIETRALIRGGMNADQALATARKAIQALKDAGVSAPTRIPWGE